MAMKGWTEDEREIAWRYGDDPPRRVDWYRIAALTLDILAACAAAAALIVGVGLVLTAF